MHCKIASCDSMTGIILSETRINLQNVMHFISYHSPFTHNVYMYLLFILSFLLVVY